MALPRRRGSATGGVVPYTTARFGGWYTWLERCALAKVIAASPPLGTNVSSGHIHHTYGRRRTIRPVVGPIPARTGRVPDDSA